jgi:ribonuclease T2
MPVVLAGALLSAALCLAFVSAGSTTEEEPPAGESFDYYVLVLGWSPSYCATEEARRRDDPHCAQKRRGFTLHGLWPQYFEGWPSDCWSGRRPWIPEQVIEEMRDIMPSKGLVIHEYRTHGTCTGLTPEQYFGVARGLYERIAMPESFDGVTGELRLSPEEIEAEFLNANPWLKHEMIAVTCRREALRDVRICFGRDLFPMGCGKNEETRVCGAGDVSVSPAPPR